MRAIERRGRTAVLWGLTAFVLFQLGLAVAIEGWWPALRDPEYGYRIDRLRRRTTAVADRPCTVVMLGSSRTTAGFRAGQLERDLRQRMQRPVVAYNFGTTGAGPLIQLLHLRRFLARGVRPDMLLIEVLPPLLDGKDPDAERTRLPVSRLWHEDLRVLMRYGAARRELRSAWWSACLLPWSTHRYAIVSRVAPALVPYPLRMDWVYQLDDSGETRAVVRAPDPERYRRAVEHARQEYAPRLAGYQLGGLGCRALQEQLDLCHRHGIAPVLVVMPEGSAFRGWYPPGAWEQVEAFLDQLHAEHQVPIINARTWIADEQFADSHHLLPCGATEFTARLGRALPHRPDPVFSLAGAGHDCYSKGLLNLHPAKRFGRIGHEGPLQR